MTIGLTYSKKSVSQGSAVRQVVGAPAARGHHFLARRDILNRTEVGNHRTAAPRRVVIVTAAAAATRVVVGGSVVVGVIVFKKVTPTTFLQLNYLHNSFLDKCCKATPHKR